MRRDTRMTNRNFTGCNKTDTYLHCSDRTSTGSAQYHHQFKLGTRSDQHAEFLQIPPSAETSQKIISFLGKLVNCVWYVSIWDSSLV